jgi:uncharacterized protein DUF1444
MARETVGTPRARGSNANGEACMDKDGNASGSGKADRTFCDQALPYLKASLGSIEVADIIMKEGQEPVLRCLAHGISVGYLVDKGNYYQYIQLGHLTAESIDEERLHQTAVQNLTAFARERLRIEKRGNVFCSFLDGNMEASLLLIDELWDQSLAHLAPTGFIAAVPARDILAFCDASFPEGIAELREIVKRVTPSGDHLITTMLLRRDGNKVGSLLRIDR